MQHQGASLVAISPQRPDTEQAVLLKNFLQYAVLSDLGNIVARQFGLVYRLDEAVQKLFRGYGVDLAAVNGDDSWELPLPGTFVIDRTGIVRLAFVDVDYTKRLEPAAILDTLAALAGG
jgi:peroxiredoxin